MYLLKKLNGTSVLRRIGKEQHLLNGKKAFSWSMLFT